MKRSVVRKWIRIQGFGAYHYLHHQGLFWWVIKLLTSQTKHHWSIEIYNKLFSNILCYTKVKYCYLYIQIISFENRPTATIFFDQPSHSASVWRPGLSLVLQGFEYEWWHKIKYENLNFKNETHIRVLLASKRAHTFD